MNPPRHPSLAMTPWYKQIGAWVLILLLLGIIVAGIVFLLLASRGTDEGTGGYAYASDGVGDGQLQSKQRALLKGISAVTSFSDNSVSVSVIGPVEDDVLKLELSHPRETGSQVTLKLNKIDQGLYSGDLPSPISAGWHWTLRSDEGEGWRIDGDVEVDDLGYDDPN